MPTPLRYGVLRKITRDQIRSPLKRTKNGQMLCIFILAYFSAVVKLDGFLNGEQAMETKATSKGQITIPAEIQERLGIKDGTYLHVEVNDAKQIVLTPVTRGFVQSLRGKYKGMGLMKALRKEKLRDL